ncbi:MAG TPA: hypothetical protein VFQ07_03660 [Candidatus Polarisedimenticolia bacterium]|nr:hypothetical protein [Candidatus Polarisedimenticolia bacterium]
MGFGLFLFGALVFFGLLALLFAIIAIPLLLGVAVVIAAVRLAFFVLVLPFRLVGWMFGLALGRHRTA